MYQQQGLMGYPAANMPTPAPGSTGMGPSQTGGGMGTRRNQETGGNTDTNVENNDHQQQRQQSAPIAQPYAWGQPPAFSQQWNWNVPRFGGPFQIPGTRIGQVYLRIIAGMLLLRF